MKRVLSPWIVPILQIGRRMYYYFIYHSLKNFTMIPSKDYITNLEICRHFKVVEGDVVECGTWRGGMIAGIKYIMGNDRTYHLYDSFEGLPEVKVIDGVEAKNWQLNTIGSDYYDNCTASEQDAQKAILKAGIKHYTLNKGWFKDTLVNYKNKKGIAILRLDGDWYDSTMECLNQLFPFVNSGGVVIIDDYYRWEGCSKAVHDYLSLHKSSCKINSFRDVCFILKNSNE